MKKKLLVIAVVVMVMSIATLAAAGTLISKIDAEIRRDFKVYVDGERQTFKSATGEVVYPILHEGTTYLPLRAIGELMGKKVYWYEDDKKIELKEEKTTVTDADVIVTDTKPTTDKPSENPPPKINEDKEKADFEKAKNIALKKAGFTEKEVRELEVEFEDERGVRYYQVEFEKDNYDYEVLITTDTFEIFRFDKESDR